MNLLLLTTLALATTGQAAAPAPAPASPNQQAYNASVTCASAHIVAGMIVGRMGDATQQAELRKLADNFELVSVRIGATLGFDRPTVLGSLAQASAERVAEVNAISEAPDHEAQMAAWGAELNEQLGVCRQFAARLAAAD